ncbi:MAG: TetR/AcrR family transcriptional regulator [Oculatellaceae cyanobacterium bins.114]|nr:TetR/AcrR family transcriptional regulator [Oculatellaceae cyanobacterium bins.114]
MSQAKKTLVKNGRNTKARMIAKTVDLFRVQGYHATGLNQILQESNAPKGSLYFHFPGGKEELAIAAIQLAGVTESQNMEAALNSNEDVGEAVKALILFLAEGLNSSDFRRGCPVATVAVEASATHDSLRQICEQIYREWFTLIQNRLQKSGFSADLAETWSMLILTSIEGALLLSRTQQSTHPLEAIADHLSQLLTQVSL